MMCHHCAEKAGDRPALMRLIYAVRGTHRCPKCKREFTVKESRVEGRGSRAATVGMLALLLLWNYASGGVIADRFPHAYVKTTPMGLLLRSEANWKGHVRPVAEIKEASGQRWLLVEPKWSLPPSVVPSTNNFVTQVIVNGVTNRGLWFQGRTVTVP